MQYKAAAKNENNSTETDHASMPLGIFASKSDVGIAMPTYFDFASKSVFHKTNIGGAGTPPYGATHVAHCDKYRRVAFTLAEVLITLGIIGVVAALTIPTLMFQYQKKSLETQFKAAYSLINQAILMVKQETGSNSLYNDYVVYSPEKDYYKRDEFIKEFYKYMHATNEVIPNNIQYSIYSDGHVKRHADNTSFSFETPDKILANGMTMYATINGGLDGKHIIFCVDVNGIKPPNRMGHDLFLFIVDSSDKLVGRKQMKIYTDEELGDLSSGGINNALGLPCSKHSKQSANGIGCTWYAINDVCPDDNTKGYWECLPR